MVDRFGGEAAGLSAAGLRFTTRGRLGGSRSSAGALSNTAAAYTAHHCTPSSARRAQAQAGRQAGAPGGVKAAHRVVPDRERGFGSAAAACERGGRESSPHGGGRGGGRRAIGRTGAAAGADGLEDWAVVDRFGGDAAGLSAAGLLLTSRGRLGGSRSSGGALSTAFAAAAACTAHPRATQRACIASAGRAASARESGTQSRTGSRARLRLGSGGLRARRT